MPLYCGLPGPECGHAEVQESYFDRCWCVGVRVCGCVGVWMCVCLCLRVDIACVCARACARVCVCRKRDVCERERESAGGREGGRNQVRERVGGRWGRGEVSATRCAHAQAMAAWKPQEEVLPLCEQGRLLGVRRKTTGWMRRRRMIIRRRRVGEEAEEEQVEEVEVEECRGGEGGGGGGG